MTKQYQKIDDNNWVIVETKETRHKINVENLLEEKAYYEKILSDINTQIAEIEAEKAKEK